MPNESAPAEHRQQTNIGIYRHIYETKEFCSKQTLARDLNLSLPTVYQHLSELMEEGLVRYSGEYRTTGGRKAAGITVTADARFAVGISMVQSCVRYVAADLRLQELAYRKIRREFTPDIPEYNTFIAEELERFLTDFGLDRERLLGVGIAVPGVLSADGKAIISAPTLGLKNVDLGDIAAKIPYPLHIENDASCGGHAEWFMRRRQRDMVYLSLEEGVGGAVLVDGQIYRGDNRRSGEFGHMCVEPGGLLCSCGKRGCLEAYCSTRRISSDLGITLEEFFEGLQEHRSDDEELWYDLLRRLAVGINNIRMVLDCETVLGGYLSEYIEPYMPQLRQYVIEKSAFDTDADYLHLSNLRRHTISLGAACHFVQRFINNRFEEQNR